MDMKEFGDQLEKMHTGITATQEKVDAMGTTNAETQEVATKAAKDVGDAIEKINQMKLDDKLTEVKDRMEDVETAIATSGGQGDEKQNAEYSHDMAAYMRKGTAIAPELHEATIKRFMQKSLYGADEAEIDAQVKDLVAGSGPDGGYHIIAERSNRMIERIFETSPIRGLANLVTTTSDVFEFILDDDEADCEWVGEVSSRDDTGTPKIGMIKIPAHEIFAQPKASQKMLDDAGFDIEGWLNRKVSSRIGRKENTSFVVGDGAEKPKGFLDYANWAVAGQYQRNAVEQITSGTSGSFDGDDLINLQNQLIEDYQTGATWSLKRATFTTIMQLKGSNGQYLLNPRVLSEGGDKVLLGASVTFMNDMPGVAANALSIAIADWTEFYTIVDRFDIRVLRDPYTAKPYIKFYTTKRTGGAVTNYEAGKILKIQA